MLKFNHKDLTDDLTDEEETVVFTFIELLATAGLSDREFFHQGSNGYCNRDNFRPAIHFFTRPESGFKVIVRRRDGFTTYLHSPDTYRILRPKHVQSTRNVQIDTLLLNSLLNAQQQLDDAGWLQVFESIIGFNSANTDNAEVSGQTEVVLLVGAFQRLLNCTGGKENELAQQFNLYFRPTHDIEFSNCSRFVGVNLQNRFHNSSTVRDIWIRDLTRLRGDLAHGVISPKYPAIWSLRNHLLLSSFLFPLLLKCYLVRAGCYTLTDDDTLKIELFEQLACAEHFFEQSGSDSFPWNDIFYAARYQQLVKSIKFMIDESTTEL